ncbi:MAG: excinuclease ABC subunit UvrC [Treponema sp.]|nr:excinuclease ABC subunit UvrC [Treponema sp.]
MQANTTFETLHKIALQAPSSSGVYLWKNSDNAVIYVGKAKNLKHRLCSYFTKGKDVKTRLLVLNAISLEYITTSNEYEAFLLENTLIKKHNPRYNINLKDGKSYPVLRITKEEFPRVFKTRRVLQDGSTYFGPFPDAGALDTFIDAIYHIYPIRHCKVLHKRESPCIYYHIKWCKAPCCKKITSQSYNEYIGEICSLLEGKDDSGIHKITLEMKKAASELNFEKAARLRDGLSALSIMMQQNIVESFDSTDKDYIAYWREGELVSFTVLKLRGGKLQARDNYRVISLNEDSELTEEFFNAYYTESENVPPSIYVALENFSSLSNADLSQWFLETLKVQTKIIPISDKIENAKYHKAAIDMAMQNAHEDITRRLRERGDMPALEELKSLLNLATLPVRIEGFDIAHIAGKFPVASLISFYNGNPDKKNYRYFRLKTTDGIIDDFASLKEATSRRYTRLLNEQADLPDLILIDGGIGQVNAVHEIILSLGLDIPIVGLAKKEEEIYRPGNSTPLILPKRSDALRLLQRVRDETHRFATSRNQKLRTKENTVSIFLRLPNIGEKRARTLLKNFNTLENLLSSEKEKIESVLNISEKDASLILESAKKLYEEQEEQKNKMRAALQTAESTRQNAEHAHELEELAESALAE